MFLILVDGHIGQCRALGTFHWVRSGELLNVNLVGLYGWRLKFGDLFWILKSAAIMGVRKSFVLKRSSGRLQEVKLELKGKLKVEIQSRSQSETFFTRKLSLLTEARQENLD